MAVVLTERMKPELMTCHDIVATGRYPYTGRLGILTREDEEKVEEAMKAVHAVKLLAAVILTTSVMVSARECFLHARSARNRILLFWMSLPHSWISNISWIFYLFFGIWQRKKQITVIMSLHEIDLAQKIADKIICVKGDTISHFGKPEEIFEENMIRELV